MLAYFVDIFLGGGDICICVCVYKCIHFCVYVCIHAYICMYTYICIHTHIYAYPIYVSVYLSTYEIFSPTVVKCMSILFHKHSLNVFYCCGIVLSLREGILQSPFY